MIEIITTTMKIIFRCNLNALKQLNMYVRTKQKNNYNLNEMNQVRIR